MELLETLDLGFSRPKKRGMVDSVILWATRRRGEPESLATHTFLMCSPVLSFDAHMAGININNFRDQYETGEYEYAVYRFHAVTEEDKEFARIKLRSWTKRARYSKFKIVLQLGDGLISKITGKDVWVFRRLGRFSDRFIICSWASGVMGNILKWWTGCSKAWAKRSAPDDLLDHVITAALGEWRLVRCSPGFFPDGSHSHA